MQKTKIEWVAEPNGEKGYTWNPVTGCLHNCPYCYAKKIAQRFGGEVKEEKANGARKTFEIEQPIICKDKIAAFPFKFSPTLYKYRLNEPKEKKKPSRIFVCSMADLFGEWVPDEWIKTVFEACEEAPQHIYLFLTKNPIRYMDLAEKGIIKAAANYWYGSTTTRPKEQFFWHDYLNTFASIEPMLESFAGQVCAESVGKAKWVIMGAETGNRKGKVKPERAWIEDMVDMCRATNTPVFLKNNLKAIWGEDLIQEWPDYPLVPF